MVRCSALFLSLVMALVWAGSALAAPNGVKSNVTVRGFWSITVLNADGSVASQTEFENAYDPNSTVLALLLARSNEFLGMEVRLDNFLGDKACVNGGGAPSPCRMAEPTAPLGVSPAIVKTLQAAVVDATDLQLNGSIVASATGQILHVTTRGYFSDGANGSTASQLTRHDFPAPIDVQEGQQIQTTVTITFGPIQ